MATQVLRNCDFLCCQRGTYDCSYEAGANSRCAVSSDLAVTLRLSSPRTNNSSVHTSVFWALPICIHNLSSILIQAGAEFLHGVLAVQWAHSRLPFVLGVDIDLSELDLGRSLTGVTQLQGWSNTGGSSQGCAHLWSSKLPAELQPSMRVMQSEKAYLSPIYRRKKRQHTRIAQSL